jgi:hypothetical protein
MYMGFLISFSRQPYHGMQRPAASRFAEFQSGHPWRLAAAADAEHSVAPRNLWENP